MMIRDNGLPFTRTCTVLRQKSKPLPNNKKSY